MGSLRRAWRRDPGLVLSGGVHGLALVLLLVGFSRAPKFEDAIETIPVDMISSSDLNEITNGEKTAKPLPKPQRRVDKLAELEDHKPLPPTPDAKKDVPPLPSPEKANDDPGHAEKAEPLAATPPPPPPVPTPPARPAEAKAAEPKAAEVKPPPPDAEALAPKPPPRPKEPKEAKDEPKTEPAPVPPTRPIEKKVAKAVPPPPKRPDVKPEPTPKETLDDVAKLLDKMKPPKPVAKLRSGNEVKEAKSHEDFSVDKISALLDHDTAQRKASTGRSLAQTAALGSPTAHAEKLSPSMAAQLDGWLIDHYRGCWSYFGLGATQSYVPQLRIRMAQDGSLIGQPALLNPPTDPNLKSLADSAIRAVNRCNPLEIPARFRPYYDEGYKQRIVRFDPKEMS